MKIVGISGSARINSYNTGLIIKAQDLLSDSADFTMIDISRWPLYDQDLEAVSVPDEVVAAKELVREADGVVMATPEHNYSITALLKNAIDWMSRPPIKPFASKPVLIVGASPGQFGSLRAQLHARDIMHALNAKVFSQPQLLVSGVKMKVNTEGVLTDEKTIEIYGNILNAWIDSIKEKEPALH
jgi:chromate reductase, NAD(P)H dehydrogenase (quinone)